MWVEDNNDIQMTVGDYGVAEPFHVSGVTLSQNDSVKFVFSNGIEKEYTPSNNGVELMFTAEESAQFRPGTYPYRLDWYREGVFLCNLIPCGVLTVISKAGVSA